RTPAMQPESDRAHPPALVRACGGVGSSIARATMAYRDCAARGPAGTTRTLVIRAAPCMHAGPQETETATEPDSVSVAISSAIRLRSEERRVGIERVFLSVHTHL